MNRARTWCWSSDILSYYPRFGFTLASGYGIRPPFDVPDEAMMALALDDTRAVPRGTIRYPGPFGV